MDYPKEHYEKYQEEAEAALRQQLVHILQHDDANVVLDFSFAFREDREAWKALISEFGGRWVLVYLNVDPTEIRRRVAARNALIDKDGDSAFYLTEDLLERYINGFERPVGEGEIHQLGLNGLVTVLALLVYNLHALIIKWGDSSVGRACD